MSRVSEQVGQAEPVVFLFILAVHVLDVHVLAMHGRPRTFVKLVCERNTWREYVADTGRTWSTLLTQFPCFFGLQGRDARRIDLDSGGSLSVCSKRRIGKKFVRVCFKTRKRCKASASAPYI